MDLGGLQPIFEFLVFLCALPLVYLAILIFVVLLIVGSSSPRLRVRSIVGVFAGLLIFLIFVILDLTTRGISLITIDPGDTLVAGSFAIASLIFGFVVLVGIDLFLRRGAVSFVIFFLTGASLISVYFLFRASDIRPIISSSTVAFLLGSILYLMLNGKMLERILKLPSRGKYDDDDNDNDSTGSRWKL